MSAVDITKLLDERYDEVRAQSYVALDVPAWADALPIVEEFGDAVDGYKVGLELFYGSGYQAVDTLIDKGKRVFLDLKLHDIPTTVSRALRVICARPIEVVNVHASGGHAMLKAACEAVDSAEFHPKLIGVTVLTSLSDNALGQMGIGAASEELVLRWSRMCQECGLNGVVASAMDVEGIVRQCGKEFFTVVPGTRPKGAAQHDQRRSLTPGQAIGSGASALVLGRAVTQAPDRVKALRDIWEDMRVGVQPNKVSRIHKEVPPRG